MGILKELTKEYFGEKVRKEDEIDIFGLEVEIVSFKDNNGKYHERGYKPKDRDTLKKLLKRMIEVRGDEGDFNDIDTSEITSMLMLFFGNTTFNGDISGWKFQKVSTTSLMFCGATSFNQDISKWKFPNVRDMNSMFYCAKSFNQPIGDWEFPNVTDMGGMFYGVTSFNQPIGNWKFPKVTDMNRMFYNATSFNQDLSKWDLKGKSTTDMFFNCPLVDKYKQKMK